MDFFEHQEQARRKTGWLALLFTLALAGLIGAVYLLVTALTALLYGFEPGLLVGLSSVDHPSVNSPWAFLLYWDAETFFWVVLCTVLVVVLGSIHKVLELREGGSAVAVSLGGRLMDQSAKSPQERQLLNVVEEMAIASGTATPPVYVLDHEPGINAFAAGHSPEDAAIGVTQGCVVLLSREELQGVIAHEFSHILNGDMRLNMHLMGLVHGILIIGLTGRFLLRGFSRRQRYGYGVTRISGRGGLAAIAIGVGLVVIGSLGVFFGNLIKAAISRQREFLADASAVQFTRLPEGLIGALKKIGGLSEGSEMLDPETAAVSHMFFSQGFSGGLDSIFATHPPLAERIQRIEPRFNGQFPSVERSRFEDAVARATVISPVSGLVSGQAKTARPSRKQPVEGVVAQIGKPTAAHLEHARKLVQNLPTPVREAAQEPYGARAVIYTLLLNKEPEARKVQMDHLAAHADPSVHKETLQLTPAMVQVDPAARLPLIDMAVPALAKLSAIQYDAFRGNVHQLIQADEKVNLFEWMLRHLLLRHLEPRFRPVKRPIVQYYSLKRLTGHCAAVLSALAYHSRGTDEQAKVAFERGANHLQLTGLALQPRNRAQLTAVGEALDILAECSPREKRKIMQACAASILADKTVTVEECELLRVIADSLRCPMPPLLPGQAAA